MSGISYGLIYPFLVSRLQMTPDPIKKYCILCVITDIVSNSNVLNSPFLIPLWCIFTLFPVWATID